MIAACSAKPGSAEDYPFGDEVAVFKVVGKMFALVTLGLSPCSVSLKCDPDLAVGLRRRYAAITAGYHLHKRHWNTVTLDGSVPEAELLDLIDHCSEAAPGRPLGREKPSEVSEALLRIGNVRVTVTRLLPKVGAESMRYYEASSMIASSPEAVWAVLTDRAAWPSWDSGVDGVDGQIAPGEKITIRSQAAPGRAFPVKVTDFDPPARLRFSGGVQVGLFRGARTFEVSPDGNGGTAFHVREKYTGPLLGLIWRSMPDLGPSSGRFAQGLKRRVETGR